MLISEYTRITKGPDLPLEYTRLPFLLAFSAVALPLLPFLCIEIRVLIHGFCCDSVVAISFPGTTYTYGAR